MSISWDAALLNISVGGYSRRVDWDNPNFYVYNPEWEHYPIDLNNIKLFQCDTAECNDPERYHPTEGDKHADDWISTVPRDKEDQISHLESCIENTESTDRVYLTWLHAKLRRVQNG